MKESELKKALLQDNQTLSTQALAQTAMPITDDRLQRFLEQAGLTEEDVAGVGIKNPELLLALLTPSWQRYLRLGQWDKLVFKGLMLPFMGQRDVRLSQQPSSLARVWPRSTSLLFERPRVLMQAYMTTDFLKSTQFAADVLLSGVIYSLMTMELANVGVCPQNYTAGDIVKLLVGYANPLSSLLTDVKYWPYLAALLPGIPLLWGGSKGLIAALDARPVNRPRLNQILNHLKQYQPHYVQDTLRWLIPLSSLSRVHKHITRVLMWDGRPLVTPEKRIKLADALCENARTSRRFTRLNAIDSLADIVEGIAPRDIVYLQQHGVEKATLLATLYAQQRALEELRYQADNYPLGRYLYANYRLWQLGQPRQRLLQPGFWALEGLRAYATLSLILVFSHLVYDAIDKAVKKQACLNQGKQWTFIELINDFNCTACPDLKLFYPDTFTDKSCFEAYFRQRRPLAEILYAIDRFDLAEVKSLSLFHHSLNHTELGFVLERLQAKAVKLTERLDASGQNSITLMTLEEAQRIANTLPSFQLTDLVLRGRKIGSNHCSIILKALEHSPLLTLDLSNNMLDDSGLQVLEKHYPAGLKTLNVVRNLIKFDTLNLTSLLQGPLEHLDLGLNLKRGNIASLRRLGAQLQLSHLTSLGLSQVFYESRDRVKNLLDYLPLATLEVLDLKDNHLNATILNPLFVALRQSKLKKLYLRSNPIGREGPRLFTGNLHHTSLEVFHLDYNGIDDEGFITLAKQLNQTVLHTLLLYNNPAITDRGISALGQHLAQSQLRALDLSQGGCNFTSKGLARLLDGAINSSLEELGLSGSLRLGDEGVKLIADYLPRLKLTTLFLEGNNITAAGAAALAKSLPFSVLKELYLGANRGANPLVGNKGVEALARYLPASQLNVLDLTSVGMADNGALALAQALPDSSLISLNLNYNKIGDVGAKALAQVLMASPCHRLGWTAWEGFSQQNTLSRPKTNLSALSLFNNQLGTEGAIALCQALPSTAIPIQQLNLEANQAINASLVGIYTCHITSAGSSLNIPWPYLMLYRSYLFSRQLVSDSYQDLQALNSPEQSEALFNSSKTLQPSAEKTPPISTQTIVAYGALYLTAGYLLNEGITSLTRWWQGASVKPVYVETSTQQLTALQKQLASVKQQLDDFNPLRLTAEQQILLNTLHYTVEDTEAQLDKLRYKWRANPEQLQLLEDELSDTETGLEELRQELRTSVKPTSYYQGIRFFQTVIRSPDYVERRTLETANINQQGGMRYE